MKTFVELVVKRQWLLFICFVTAAIGCKSTQQLPAVHADFFVAADGNDANPGTADKPFATLARARDAVRQKIAAGLDHNMVVMIRGGRYELTEPLVLRSEDSGTEKFAVTYAAAPTERVEISGGRFIRGWKRGSDHLWIADVTGTSHARWTVHQVFVNAQRRQRAKSPNAGFFHVEGQMSKDAPVVLKSSDAKFLKTWADAGDVEVVLLPVWSESRVPIKALEGGNDGSSAVILAGACIHSDREANARFWIENAREALDAPGEWYFDRQAGRIYYWPLPGEDLTKAEVIAPVLPMLVQMDGVRNVHWRGLTFAHTDWTLPASGYQDRQAAHDIPAAIEVTNASGCSIEDCTLNHLGKYAVEFGKGCKDNRVVGNEMTDLGAGGVKIGTAKLPGGDAEWATNNQITDNHIHDIGIVYPAAVGVWIGQSAGNLVAHNHIHDTFYSGISVGWTWGYGASKARGNIIEFNHVHHIGRDMLSDMGGIYTLGIQPGTIIRNNLFHDISSYTYGGWGIYPDEGSTDIVIENNVVYRTKSGGFHQHYGRDNIVRNNIFAYAKEGQVIRSRVEDHVSFIFEHNIVLWNEGQLLGGGYSDKPSEGYKFDNNVYFDQRGPSEKMRIANWSFEEWQKLGQDVHSVIADPLFVDPAHGNFTLKPDSPAIKMGFKPIDTAQVGPRERR